MTATTAAPGRNKTTTPRVVIPKPGGPLPALTEYLSTLGATMVRVLETPAYRAVLDAWGVGDIEINQDTDGNDIDDDSVELVAQNADDNEEDEYGDSLSVFDFSFGYEMHPMCCGIGVIGSVGGDVYELDKTRGITRDHILALCGSAMIDAFRALNKFADGGYGRPGLNGRGLLVATTTHESTWLPMLRHTGWKKTLQFGNPRTGNTITKWEYKLVE